jgi:hypothetical protein
MPFFSSKSRGRNSNPLAPIFAQLAWRKEGQDRCAPANQATWFVDIWGAVNR